MDIDVSGWILEFILRQNSLDDKTLINLIRILPLPNNNPRLKKALILRQLQHDIAKGTISHRTINYLEQIEELDHKQGVDKVSDAMKAAYCTVMMHLTAELIDKSDVGYKELKYETAVRRIWSGRVCKMERFDVGLVEDDLGSWVRGVEGGVLDVDVCENVLGMFRGVDVVEVVRRYVDEAKEKMGPSFLELACEAVMSDDGLSEALGLDEVSELRNVSTDDHGGSKSNASSAHEASKFGNQSKDSAPTDDTGVNKALKAHGPPTQKHVASRRQRGAKIVDPMETSHDRYDYIPSPEVRKVQEALESSSLDLHAVVKDPLPDAIRLAESLKANTSGDNEAHDLAEGNLNRANDGAPNSSHDRKGKALEVDGNDGITKDENRRIKANLFERNNTAHTMEWSDSSDSSEEGAPRRPHLSSPQKRRVSPLNVYKMEKLVKQRKKKRWTVLEEDTLRTGVQKYGKGNWKLILTMYRDIFEDRTEVDLKDKWRNLTR